MRPRCWGNGFPEDRLNLFLEARAVAVDRRGTREAVCSQMESVDLAMPAGCQMCRGAVCAGSGVAFRLGARLAGGVLHEGGVLLGKVWVYSTQVGGSCSTHNPWPVDPDPRGVGRFAVFRWLFVG